MEEMVGNCSYIFRSLVEMTVYFEQFYLYMKYLPKYPSVPHSFSPFFQACI